MFFSIFFTYPCNPCGIVVFREISEHFLGAGNSTTGKVTNICIERRASCFIHLLFQSAMKSVFLSSVLLIGLSVASLARIGETVDEAVKRYGNVVRHERIHDEEYYLFEKSGFHVLAHFHDGKVDRILYSSDSRRKLTHEEIDTFLKANNGGRLMNEDLPYVWVGKHAAATYSKWHGGAWRLDIKARTFGHRRIVAQKAVEKAKLEGF